VERENRYLEKEREKEIEFQRLLADWQDREKDFEKERLKEQQREARKAEELKALIQDDLDYDSSDDKYRKSCPLYSKSAKGR
jgi:hypothetical protein